MRLEDLIDELSQGTTIQKEERLKGLIGVNVEITSSISNVDSNAIHLDWLHADYKLSDVLMRSPVAFDKTRFGNQLLSYSAGDDVELTAKLRSASVASDLGFGFDLVSISKVGTTYQSRQEAERRAKESKSACFIATACYGDVNAPDVVLLKQFRDDVLVRNLAGRLLVRFYCWVSPPIVGLLVDSVGLRRWVRRCCVAPVVAVLRWSDRRAQD